MRKPLLMLFAGVGALTLSACASSDPTAAPADSNGEALTIGTANFPESDIIGHVYAEALEEAGFDVEVNSGIGSREVYLSAIETGDVQVFPEYIGSLALYYDAQLPDGADPEAIAGAAREALPEALALGDLAPGENSDAFHVMPEVAEEYGLETLADLDNLETIRWATLPETTERAFNAEGLAEAYDIDAEKFEYNFISDGGGPLTVTALRDGVADVANIFGTSPTYDSDGEIVETVILADPAGLITHENIVPLYRADDVPAEALEVINEVNATLTTEQLREFNERNTGPEKASPQDVAADYVAGLDI